MAGDWLPVLQRRAQEPVEALDLLPAPGGLGQTRLSDYGGGGGGGPGGPASAGAGPGRAVGGQGCPGPGGRSRGCSARAPRPAPDRGGM
jgi:hypothetical protein